VNKSVTEIQLFSQSSSSPFPSVREMPHSLLIPKTACFPPAGEDIQCSAGDGQPGPAISWTNIMVAAVLQIFSSLPSLPWAGARGQTSGRSSLGWPYKLLHKRYS